MNILVHITPFVFASLFPLVDALLVERSRDLSSETSTANPTTYTSSSSTGVNQARATWFYIVIVGGVCVFLLTVALCIVRIFCASALSCCSSKSSNNNQMQYGNRIIVPVYEQPPADSVPHPYARGGYQGPYYNPQAEQYRAEPYPLAYTPMSAKSTQANSSRASMETEPAGNYQSNQPPYNTNQQFQGR